MTPVSYSLMRCGGFVPDDAVLLWRGGSICSFDVSIAGHQVPLRVPQVRGTVPNEWALVGLLPLTVGVRLSIGRCKLSRLKPYAATST